ncbi:MAG: transcription-repair coupling factor [Phycisphaerales bacterium]
MRRPDSPTRPSSAPPPRSGGMLLTGAIVDDPRVVALADRLGGGGEAAAIGSAGSSTNLIAAAIQKRTGRMVVLVPAHLDEADEAVEELVACGLRARRFPALEQLPGESGVSLELFAERLAVVRALSEDEPIDALVCPMPALMQMAPRPEALDTLAMVLRPGDARGPEAIVRWLDMAGYSRADAIEEPGDFAVRGGIIDIFPPAGAATADDAPQSAGEGVPIRLDFFGDDLESITEVDLDTMGSDRRLSRVELIGVSLEALGDASRSCSVLDLVPESAIALIAETTEVVEQGRGYYERAVDASAIEGPPGVLKRLRSRFHALCEINQFTAASLGEPLMLPVAPLPEFARDASAAIAELARLAESREVVVCCQNDGERERLTELLAEFAPDARVRTTISYLHRGFLWEPDAESSDDQKWGGLALVPHHELFHRYQTRRRIRRLKAGRSAEAFYELEPGDFVVHADHGIAKFIGLKTMRPAGPKKTAAEEAEAKLREHRRKSIGKKEREREDLGPPPEEYLTLEFAKGSKLHVPVTQIDRVQKYVGSGAAKPVLSMLGGKRWQSQKDAVKESVRDLAAELLRLQAARAAMPGTRFPHDTAWQKEFEAEFPYQETDDQLAAMSEIKRDMGSTRPMDRLLCGDVGYGKTELAIRAAFKAAEYGKQVAVLVPTTLLAEQHERTFRSRMADYPFRIESLSRLKDAKSVSRVLAAVAKGEVDILIGTHRLLSNDVKFADLALVIVDEEQRFGVEHKHKLLELRATVDVLTLSATPIPRTLHMSMLGLRDISSLTTPPLDRRAVVTEVLPYNEQRIKRAIARELSREGQIFIVYNRVHGLQVVADDIRRLAPDARIVVGHGQMTPGELEEVMRRFVTRQADILVSTTIIESGIDIPTANTMIILEADLFGLAELHQLRGRVGRHKHRAYCYFMLPKDRPPTEKAVKRLRAIEEFSMLGAGFKIAMRDLEIRGAGNLLGPEQSGHIAAVGYDMYCRLLEQAGKELRNEPAAELSETTVEIGVTASIPKPYIPSDRRRLEAYRRIATAQTLDDLRQVEHDLTTAYGKPPAQAQRLIELAELRVVASALGVRSITRHDKDVVFRCRQVAGIEPLLREAQGTVRVLGERDETGLAKVYYRPPENYLNPLTLLRVLRARLVGDAGVAGAPSGR